MSDYLEIFLLGGMTIKRNGAPVKALTSRKATALFIYLACHQQQSFSRDTLAGLFYGELPQERAMANLRVLLHRLSPLNNYLLVTRQTVAINPDRHYWLDTVTLEQQLAAAAEHAAGDTPSPDIAAQLETALGLYQGDFLAGFHLPDALGFEEWVVVEQERLQRLTVEALGRLVNYYLDTSQYQSGLKQAARLLQLDPLHEAAHRQMMTLLARSGQRSAALAHYERCRRILAAELNAEPAPETTNLYEYIQELELATQEQTQVPAVRPHNLPHSLNPFVGREEELAQIAERLLNPECQLLTLVGLGGIGKTRLALQAARQLAANNRPTTFRDGIYFIPLAAVGGPEFIAPTIADNLNFSFHGQEKPEQQLIDYLGRKEMLLILDSFEHLLDGVGLVVDILQNAPRLKILAVSRERLNLQSEWLFNVTGLNYPTSEAPPETLADFSAVQLFVQTVCRIQPDFSLATTDQSAVIRICQLVEGMPLAIELAAAWLRVLSCQEIAQEIQQSLDFLRTSLHNVPERQRSLQAVFDYSWNLLSPTEQDIFGQLSVFRGKFDRLAVEHITEATLPVLATLVDKSWLTRDVVSSSDGTAVRYEMHNLLQRYAADKLVQMPEKQVGTQDCHCRYYTHFLQQQVTALQDGGQRDALQAISMEIENVRAAWNWAITQSKITEIGQALAGLFHFYDMRSWFREGVEAFGRAVAALVPPGYSLDQTEGEKGKIAGMLLARQGWFEFHLGQHAQAQAKLQRSLALLRRLRARQEMVFCLNYLAAVQRHLGEYTPAKQALEESLSICREMGDQFGASIALNILGQIASLQEDYAQAQTLCQEALAIKREIGDQWGMTYSLTYLGRVAEALGDYAQARDLFLESLAIYEGIDDRRGIAFCCQNLANVFKALGEVQEAQRLYQEALALFQEIGHQLGIEQVTISLATLKQ